MKSLRESLEHLLSNEKGIIVFDIDDTICETDEYSEKYIKEFYKDKIFFSTGYYS